MKKIFAVVLISFLGFGITVSGTGINKIQASSLKNNNYSLQNISNSFTGKLSENSDSSDLKEALKDAENSKEVKILSEEERLEVTDNIMDAVSKSALDQYYKEKTNEINKALADEIIGDSDEIQTLKLSDGSTVEIGSTDEDELVDNELNKNISLSSVKKGPFRSEPKKYGARKYTAWVKLKTLGITVATLKLGNHYSVGSYGLKMRYCSVAGTNGINAVDVNASCKVTDSKAEKVGYDMNAVGTYKVTGKYNFGYIVLTSYIQLKSLNKTKKVASVWQKFTYSD
ncbi:hypothetical protein [Saliterribacillus persicus]|uniref:Uncharacterized protein n=1 Tax=Saliterribacillus persicus TaxID=930114 RepID=A0A368Y5H6_9BACI|nr:hypothetical protein [Saliterribacillus persicus]RCW75009.1 hypothetical protein DFR57_103307 [Saliterribacillus persicus]